MCNKRRKTGIDSVPALININCSPADLSEKECAEILHKYHQSCLKILKYRNSRQTDDAILDDVFSKETLTKKGDD